MDYVNVCRTQANRSIIYAIRGHRIGKCVVLISVGLEHSLFCHVHNALPHVIRLFVCFELTWSGSFAYIFVLNLRISSVCFFFQQMKAWRITSEWCSRPTKNSQKIKFHFITWTIFIQPTNWVQEVNQSSLIVGRLCRATLTQFRSNECQKSDV